MSPLYYIKANDHESLIAFVFCVLIRCLLVVDKLGVSPDSPLLVLIG